MTAAAASRMTLANVVKGKQATPWRVFLYGPEKVGKSSFAKDAPKPIYLDVERSTEELDVHRYPRPETFDDVLAALDDLHGAKHDYQSVVLDTVDHVEPMIWVQVCRTAGVSSIEDVGGGYSKGYIAALDVWRVLLARLERLERDRGMHSILIGHSQVKTFKSPDADLPDYDRYEPKLNPKASGLLKEWAKTILFCNYVVYARKDKGSSRVKGVSADERRVYTRRTAAYDAGNRFNLPPELDLSWAVFEAAARAGTDPAGLTAMIREAAEKVGGEDGEKAIGAIARAGNDPTKLSALLEWINGRKGEE